MLSKQTIYRPVTSQTISAAGAIANPIGDGIYVARLHATADCFIAIGEGVSSASSSDMFLPAGATEYFQVRPGESVASSAATVYVTEMTS